MKTKNNNFISYILLPLFFLFVIAAVSSCGGGGSSGGGGTSGGGGGSPTTYTIGGSVSGLFETGVVLQNNGGDNLVISSNGAFTFATPTANGTGYAVTIFSQPSSHNCTITNGSGTISGANTTNMAVACQAGHLLDANTAALWRLNENSASSDAVDETGSIYHLTQFGSPDIISGQIGNGRLLDSSTKFFQRQGDANLGTALNGDWTYEGWVYLDSSFTNAAVLFIYNGLVFAISQPDTILAEVGVTAGRKIYWHQWQATNSYTEILSNATLQTGQFYHIAVSRTAQGGNLYTYRLYINGVIDTTTTNVTGLSYSVSGASHYIGLGNYTDVTGFGVGSAVLNGRLDDTRISKVSRSDAEILLSYKRGRGDTTAVVIDIDYNAYNTVTIGTQVWMKENLKVTRYRNGEAIPTTTSSSIPNDSSSKYQWAYDNNESNVSTYGRLYTWYAATDSRGLCPTGWHLPTDAEWTTLTDYLGTNAGGKMKEAGTTHWTTPNTGADNSSGWTALPGGYRLSNGTFYDIGDYGYWWSATEFSATGAWDRNLYSSSGNAFRNFDSKVSGFSVRCVRD